MLATGQCTCIAVMEFGDQGRPFISDSFLIVFKALSTFPFAFGKCGEEGSFNLYVNCLF